MVTDELADELILASDNVFCKKEADAFSSEELISYLNSKHISEIEMIGVDGNSCIKASAKGAVKCGFIVSIILSCVGVSPCRHSQACACSLSRRSPYASELEYVCLWASSRQPIRFICAWLIAARKLSVMRSVDVLIFLRYTPSKRSVLLWVEKFTTSSMIWQKY